jgi:hypothetical protein
MDAMFDRPLGDDSSLRLKNPCRDNARKMACVVRTLVEVVEMGRDMSAPIGLVNAGRQSHGMDHLQMVITHEAWWTPPVVPAPGVLVFVGTLPAGWSDCCSRR